MARRRLAAGSRGRGQPVDFRGFDAALWECTYSGGGADLHAYNLGIDTGPYDYALNFQTLEGDWAESRALFERLKASSQPAT